MAQPSQILLSLLKRPENQQALAHGDLHSLYKNITSALESAQDPNVALIVSELSNLLYEARINPLERGSSNLDTIPDYFLFQQRNLTSFASPNHLTSIGSLAFCKTGLTSVVTPSSVKYIETYAFNECTNLKEVDLSSGLLKIGVAAFESCFSLSKLVLPATLRAVEWDAFSGCRSLKEVTYLGTMEQWQQITNIGRSGLKGISIHCSDGDLWGGTDKNSGPLFVRTKYFPSKGSPINNSDLEWFIDTMAQALIELDDDLSWAESYAEKGELYNTLLRGDPERDLDDYIRDCGWYDDYLNSDNSTIVSAVPEEEQDRFEQLWEDIVDAGLWGKAEDEFLDRQREAAQNRLRKIVKEYPLPEDADVYEQEAYEAVQAMINEPI